MSTAWRVPLVVLAALTAGSAAFLFVGEQPASSSTQAPVQPEWELPAPALPDFVSLDKRWKATPPWPLPPPPPPPPPSVDAAAVRVAEVPPPVPLGVARSKRGFEALFNVQGAGTVRVAAGGRLPGGGRVSSVSRQAISWVDAKGQRQEHQMFNTYKVHESAAAGAPAPAAPARDRSAASGQNAGNASGSRPPWARGR